MGSKGGGTNTVVQQQQPPANVLQDYQNVVNQAQQVSSAPLQQYSGPMVAGLQPLQQQAITGMQNNQGIANPYINAAAQLDAGATQPISPMAFSGDAVNAYQSPYTQQVIQSTMANMQESNAEQQQGLVGNAISAGAWGGDRAAVAQGELGRQQALAENQTIAGLANQGYSQALGEFNTQQQAGIGAQEASQWLNTAGASGLANLGGMAQSTGMADTNQLLGAGTLEQQLQQAQLNIPFEQFQQQQAFPYQQTQYLANITQGIGGQSGGIGTTTSPGPSALSQYGGLALAGVGAAGMLAPYFTGAGAGAGAASGYAASGTAAAIAAEDAAAAAGTVEAGTAAEGAVLAARRGGRIGYDDGGNVTLGGGMPPPVPTPGFGPPAIPSSFITPQSHGGGGGGIGGIPAAPPPQAPDNTAMQMGQTSLGLLSAVERANPPKPAPRDGYDAGGYTPSNGGPAFTPIPSPDAVASSMNAQTGARPTVSPMTPPTGGFQAPQLAPGSGGSNAGLTASPGRGVPIPVLGAGRNAPSSAPPPGIPSNLTSDYTPPPVSSAPFNSFASKLTPGPGPNDPGGLFAPGGMLAPPTPVDLTGAVPPPTLGGGLTQAQIDATPAGVDPNIYWANSVPTGSAARGGRIHRDLGGGLGTPTVPGMPPAAGLTAPGAPPSPTLQPGVALTGNAMGAQPSSQTAPAQLAQIAQLLQQGGGKAGIGGPSTSKTPGSSLGGTFARGGRAGYDAGGPATTTGTTSAGYSSSGMPVAGGNPNSAAMMQKFMQMSPEQLQEMASRTPPTTPMGALAQRALQMKRMQPTSGQQPPGFPGTPAQSPSGPTGPTAAPTPGMGQSSQQQQMPSLGMAAGGVPLARTASYGNYGTNYRPDPVHPDTWMQSLSRHLTEPEADDTTNKASIDAMDRHLFRAATHGTPGSEMATGGRSPLGDLTRPTDAEKGRQIESMAPYHGTFTPGMSRNLDHYIPGTRIPEHGIPEQNVLRWSDHNSGHLEGLTEDPTVKVLPEHQPAQLPSAAPGFYGMRRGGRAGFYDGGDIAPPSDAPAEWHDIMPAPPADMPPRPGMKGEMPSNRSFGAMFQPAVDYFSAPMDAPKGSAGQGSIHDDQNPHHYPPPRGAAASSKPSGKDDNLFGNPLQNEFGVPTARAGSGAPAATLPPMNPDGGLNAGAFGVMGADPFALGPSGGGSPRGTPGSANAAQMYEGKSGPPLPDYTKDMGTPMPPQIDPEHLAEAWRPDMGPPNPKDDDAAIKTIKTPVGALHGPQPPAPPADFATSGDNNLAGAGGKGLAGQSGMTQPAPGITVEKSDQRSRRMSESPWLALAAMGAGMMSSRSPFPGVALGEGAKLGLQTLGQQGSAAREQEYRESEVEAKKRGYDLELKKLDQQFNYHKENMARLTQQHADTVAYHDDITADRRNRDDNAHADREAARLANQPQEAKMAQWYVDNGLAPDLQTGMSLYRSGHSSKGSFDNAVAQEKNYMLRHATNVPGSPYVNMKPEQIEQVARDNVINRRSAGDQQAQQPQQAKPDAATVVSQAKDFLKQNPGKRAEVEKRMKELGVNDTTLLDQ